MELIALWCDVPRGLLLACTTEQHKAHYDGIGFVCVLCRASNYGYITAHYDGKNLMFAQKVKEIMNLGSLDFGILDFAENMVESENKACKKSRK